MKRHEALTPLSREHHGALILAQLIKRNAPAYRGLPTDTVGKIQYAVDFFQSNLLSHFKKEEAILLKVKHCSTDVAAITEDIIAEHTLLKNMFLSLEAAPDVISVLDELGQLLQAHIRKEERILFPLIQEHCTEEELSRL